MSVTVCIPVYNRRDLVKRAIQSALDQDVEGLEVLVVDNCSTDGTWEYLKSLSDPRLRIERNDINIGMFGNFNRCGRLATGEYIVFLCSDDQLRPGFLSEAVKKLNADSRVAMLSSEGKIVDANDRLLATAGRILIPGLYSGKTITKAFFWNSAYYGINLFNYPSGIVMRGDAARTALPFRDDIGGPADIDYFFRVLQHGDLLIEDCVGCTILVHENQTAGNSKQSGQMILELINLARIHLDKPQLQPFWLKIRRQMSVYSLSWAIRMLCAGRLTDAGSATRFGSSWMAMVSAGLKRVALLGLAKLGLFVRPYARRL